MKPKSFLAALDDGAIAKAIAEAEKRTSGEIRVFICERAVENALSEAEKQFIRIGMKKTRARNGVLIFFAPKSQRFAVVGDEGVHARCGQEFWQKIVNEMEPLLKENRFTEAVVLAVQRVGSVLSQWFPHEPGDQNELPDSVERT